MPNDKLGGAIKRRSWRETAISRAFPNRHSFHGGTEVSNPLCSRLQRRVRYELLLIPIAQRAAGTDATRPPISRVGQDCPRFAGKRICCNRGSMKPSLGSKRRAAPTKPCRSTLPSVRRPSSAMPSFYGLSVGSGVVAVRRIPGGAAGILLRSICGIGKSSAPSTAWAARCSL
jgi:hypothetical protein